MKLLSTETRTVEKDPIKIEVKAITTAQQGRLVQLGSIDTLEGRVNLTVYALRDLVKTIQISGESYDPVSLADRVDLGDQESMLEFVSIGALVIEAAFPTPDEGKKSGQRQEDTTA